MTEIKDDKKEKIEKGEISHFTKLGDTNEKNFKLSKISPSNTNSNKKHFDKNYTQKIEKEECAKIIKSSKINIKIQRKISIVRRI